MVLNDDVKQMIQALVIEGDPEKACNAAYRVVSQAVDEDELGRVFRDDVLRAYRLGAGAQPDETIPEEISQLVFVEHPEETFDEKRYWITNQARRVADQVHAMRATAPRMRALGLPARNTTLLYGSPGTGKTEMARWIAFCEGLPLVYVNMSNTVDSLMGRTAKNISQVFSYAHKGSCVLMVDELDCVANARTSAARSADGELNRTTITFMQEIDRLPPGVVLLAATNRADMLDPALLRRFAQIEQVDKLPAEATHRMLENWIDDVVRKSGDAVAFTVADIEKLMLGYEVEDNVTQAIVVQRAMSMLADKLLELPEVKAGISSARKPLRAFRVIEPESGVDITRDKGRMRELVESENESWTRPLRYSGEPDGFLLDHAGKVHLATHNALAVAPPDRFEVVLSRFAD